MNENSIVRPMSVAGMFYDSSSSALKSQLKEFFDQAKIPEIKKEIKALIAPHAGYVYSGFTAAHAYKAIRERKYDCVVAIGPSHREYFDGVSVYPGKAYKTPLGEVLINNEIRSKLIELNKTIILGYEGHRSEHSLEVQLPFLQYALGDFSFVPLVMGDQNKELYNELSTALIDVSKKYNILLVASSDLSHYHPAKEALELDELVIQEVQNLAPDDFIEKFNENQLEACGGGPIAVVMKVAKEIGATDVRILHKCNSGDVSGDRNAVVGYFSAVFQTPN